MRIGIAHIEYSRRKGIERNAAELADRLVTRGHEVHFHCGAWMDAAHSRVCFHKVPTLDFVNSSRILSFALLGRRSIQRAQYDVTHSHGGVVGCDVITAHSCHRAGLKIARAFKGKMIRTEVNLGIADRIRLSLEYQNYGKRRYKKVIACSTLVKSELMEYYGVPDSDITVVPHGVDVEEFHPGNRQIFSEELRSVHGIGRGDLVLLFVGHEFARKGLEVAIRSLSLLKESVFKLLICGEGRPEAFQSLALSLGVGEQVIFVGGRGDVKRFYAAADIFIFPTLHEAFGLVITEAMASGVPVVVSRSAGAAEDIIEDGKDGLLVSNPLDAKEIATKVQALAKDPSLRKRIGLHGREKIEKYTWDSYAGRVLDVYEKVRHEKFR